MYASLFSKFVVSNPKELNPSEASNAFKQTGLPPDILEHVWNITDETDSGRFDVRLFSMALHILTRIKQGKEPPHQIPHEVRACGGAYFLDGVFVGLEATAKSTPEAPLSLMPPPESHFSTGMPSH